MTPIESLLRNPPHKVLSEYPYLSNEIDYDLWLSQLKELVMGELAKKLEPTHGYEYENGYNNAIDKSSANLERLFEDRK